MAAWAIAALLFAQLQRPPGVIQSMRSNQDFALTADPDSAAWKGIRGTFAGNDPMGVEVEGHRTEIRSRRSDESLYLLFICPSQDLFLKPDPVTSTETNKLWNWDVAEAFIGWDSGHIERYKEFEISPQGEWVDLDIDRLHPLPGGGVSWDSGFTSKARIDRERKIWYGEMRIPLKSIAPEPPKAGQLFRVNFYRMQGKGRKMVAWQPTHARSFHVPESFGFMTLSER